MEKIQNGHQSAIDEFYRRHQAKLKGVIFQVLRDETETQDVLQETLLQLWSEARRYSETLGRPLAWLTTLARRRAIDRTRRRGAYTRAKDRFALFVEREPRSWFRERADPDVCAGDLRRFLEQELRALPPSQCKAVELAYFEGLSHREIARVTKSPLGTVKTRLELGLQKLTSRVRPSGGKV